MNIYWTKHQEAENAGNEQEAAHYAALSCQLEASGEAVTRASITSVINACKKLNLQWHVDFFTKAEALLDQK